MSERIFQSQLEKLMQAKGVNQEDIAAAVGITQSAVSRWFNGSVPKSDRLSKLAAYFGVTTDELLTGHEPYQGIKLAAEAANSFEGTEEEKQLKFERTLEGLHPKTLSELMERAAVAERENKEIKRQLKRIKARLLKLGNEL